jgi:hypothetical protein
MEKEISKKRKMKFYTDINVEEPFFHFMAFELKGTRIKNRNGRPVYAVVCPKCGKKKARMMVVNDQWLFGCPVDGCKWGCNLHQLIRDFGSDGLVQKWNAGRLRDEWFPIKNRRKPGPKVNFKKDQVSTPIEGLSNDLLRLRTKGQLDSQQEQS